MTGVFRPIFFIPIFLGFFYTSLEAMEKLPSRTLHYIKDAVFTKETGFAKLVLSFDAPVLYSIAEQHVGKTGKKLTVKIENCVLNPKIERIQPDNTFIKSIQISSRHSSGSGSSVRFTIISPREIEFGRTEMSNPFRIVITMNKKTIREKPFTTSAFSSSKGSQPLSGKSISCEREVALEPSGVKKPLDLKLIVIDPGHGGRDKGATGWGGVYEKDLTLKLAKSLKIIVEESIPEVRVELTRYRDEYLSLEERVKIANTLKADLFISLHFNAHENTSIRGIETYYLNISQDKEAARVAAIENAVLRKKMTDLEAILQDLLKASSIAESAKLARLVHGHTVELLRSMSSEIKDLGVKSAPFYVLFGTTMPGILIEAGFISNKEELEMIKSTQFAQAIAKGIVEGVKLYTAKATGKSSPILQNNEPPKGRRKNGDSEPSSTNYLYSP